MTYDDSMEDYGEIELSNNDPRCPVVLVLDCSSSMTSVRPGHDEAPLMVLDSALDTLVQELHKDPLARRRVEVSFVLFGSTVHPASEFKTVDEIILPNLEPMGATSMGKALETALDAIAERKKVYRNNGVGFFRPWILLLTDGVSTDSTEVATQRLIDEESRKGVAFFPIGIEGADMTKLAKVFPPREPMKLDGMKFNELFQWLSASQAAVSASNPGDQVALPSPGSWASI